MVICVASGPGPKPVAVTDLSALKGRRVAVGVGGGIAAFKACLLVRELQRAGAEVRVAMTDAAQQFVTALTFQSLSGHQVLTNYFEPNQEANWGHLDLARWAELYIVAPATADLIAKIRAGMASDPVSTSLLACRGKILLAPAMNTAMWENAITQDNVKALLKDPRYRVVGPDSGLLADGDTGAGRLSEPEQIVKAAAELASDGQLRGKRVLITAGPTREHLDPVRFISNPSTGKMGLAIAHAARLLGAQVTVVLGPVPTAEKTGLDIVDVTTAEQMRDAVMSRIDDADFFIATAAVSDYRPATVAAQKLKKSDADEPVTFVRTPDVLREASQKVHAAAKRPVLVGFAAETERVIEHALEKLVSKNLDFIVANDVSKPGAGFGGETNTVTIIARGGQRVEASGSKREVADAVWKALLAPREESTEHITVSVDG